jgi:potassium-transporting ATPase potassium-binding subunit
MGLFDWLQIILYLGMLIALTPLLALYLARVFDEKRRMPVWPLGWLERGIYRMTGIDETEEMTAGRYCIQLLAFNAVGLLALFALLLFQGHLPFNPMKLPDVPFCLAFNTAVSFTTNTNWQAYSGETTLGNLVQSFGLTVQNFLSAATGITVLLVFIRGISRQTTKTVGNVWSDLVRSTVYVLLPLSLILSVVLVGQGVVQSWSGNQTVTTMAGGQQTIPLGPAASQIAIKQIGTNGGGFFGVNSAHPFENPTPFSNFLEMLAILLVPSALVLMYGRLIGDKRQGWMLWIVMMVLLIAGLSGAMVAEFHSKGASWLAMEGKEQRFGIVNSVLWAETTTCASNGSVNAMHSSLSPAAGGIALLNIMLGEVIFGGVGVGMTGMLVFVLITVFITGLMVGRTPEYLGKKIEAFEIKMAMIAVLAPNAMILIGSALGVSTSAGLSGRSVAGPHGLSEILYAFTSAAGNNGSAFAGLNANTNFYNIALALSMLFCRLAALVPIVLIAGGLAAKQQIPVSVGTLRTDTPLFAFVLIGVILIVGALTFFPALCLGPILEQALLGLGRTF